MLWRKQKREDLHPPEDTERPALTRDHVVWAYRLLLDREPENEDVIGPKLAGSRETSEMPRHRLTSAEVRDANRDYASRHARTLVIAEPQHRHGGDRLLVSRAGHG